MFPSLPETASHPCSSYRSPPVLSPQHPLVPDPFLPIAHQFLDSAVRATGVPRVYAVPEVLWQHVEMEADAKREAACRELWSAGLPLLLSTIPLLRPQPCSSLTV